MKKNIILEADVRASAAKYDENIATLNNYEKARDYLQAILKDKDKKEALATVKGDFKNITTKNAENPDELKLNLTILAYNAALAEKEAKSKKPGTTYGENPKEIPETARALVKEAGFDIQPNKEAQTLYTKYFNEISPKASAKEEEPVKPAETQQPAADASAPEEDSSDEQADTSSQEKTSSEEEYKYAAESPDKIAEKIKELKNNLAKNFEEKLSKTTKETTQKMYRSALNELENLTKYENKAQSQQSAFSVHPTTSSKQRAMTTAQIAYNNAKALSNRIVNKYSSKEIGSYASLYAKSASEALKRAKEKITQKIEQPSVAKDVAERVAGKVTEGLPKAGEKIKSAAESLAKKMGEKIQAKAQPSQQAAPQQTATQPQSPQQPAATPAQPQQPVAAPAQPQQTNAPVTPAKPQTPKWGTGSASNISRQIKRRLGK